MSEGFYGFMAGLSLGALACFLAVNVTASNWENAAVRAGAAEFVLLTPESRQAEFRWKECECETSSHTR